MDNISKSAFIPKKGLNPVKTPTGTSALLVISIILLIASGVVCGGAYLNVQRINGQINNPTDGLIAQNQTKEKTLKSNQLIIDDIVRLSKKLGLVQGILDSHKSIVPIFKQLGDNTLKDVRFTEFSYTYDSTANKALLNLPGEASSYEAIILQTRELDKVQEFKNIVFSSLSQPDAEGRVRFNLSMEVDPRLFDYTKVLVNE